ncbi:hypothetical protein BGZ95_011153 [Linnemannia exigua]|uniref:F-box domain-containing protein n=1 Tax=Linnemannia exigua TaxID=604196 RepID=A0AAD4H6N1_9FUNG|nr:hypothetical protein BGZ95_011153 [Linnemannia exigua]
MSDYLPSLPFSFTNEMFSPKQLPPETLDVVFRYLARRELYQCLLVSHLWSAWAEARLYSDITLTLKNLLRKNHIPLIQALKHRKHFIRRIAWRIQFNEEVLPANLLDILFNYHPVNADESSSLSYVTHQRSSAVTLSYPLGPNLSALTHFSYVGEERSWEFFDSILYSLSSLTNLELNFLRQGRGMQTYIVDMDRILTAFPHLKDLSITGWRIGYSPTRGAGRKDRDLFITSAHEDDDTTTVPEVLHPLKSFTFNPLLMGNRGSDAFTFFRRLGNLKEICIRSEKGYDEYAKQSRPWAFGRALKRYCPKLEFIGTFGPVALWFFDLPILPPNKISHIAALVQEQIPPDVSGMSARQVQALMKDRLEWRFRDQEQDELLESNDVMALFPQLKTLIFGYGHALSAQDLISLGVQARFLTRLEIEYMCSGCNYASDMYDKDHPAAAVAVGSTIHPAADPTGTSRMIEDRRLRKRRVLDYRDVLLFLQLCPTLRHFSLTGVCIPFKYFVDVSNSNNSRTATTTANDEETPVIRPWACEGTLETLQIGFEFPDRQPEQHRLVWKHLGRFKNLRSLTFVRLPFSRNSSALIPSFSHGLEGLLEGRGPAGTLQEIRWLPEWWKIKNRRELVLWLARSFPRLGVLGLMFNRTYVEGETGAPHIAFLEDEEVKQCSILSVFVESLTTLR